MPRSEPVDNDAGPATAVAKPEIDVVEDVFVTVPPSVLARVLADPVLWRRWCPDLVLRVLVDRGEHGVQWSVTGALRGSMEVWLEPVLDGTVLHYFLRAEPPTPVGPSRHRAARLEAARRARRVAAENVRRRLVARRLCFALKRRFERDREPGCPPSGHDSDVSLAPGGIADGPDASPGGTE